MTNLLEEKRDKKHKIIYRHKIVKKARQKPGKR